MGGSSATREEKLLLTGLGKKEQGRRAKGLKTGSAGVEGGGVQRRGGWGRTPCWMGVGRHGKEPSSAVLHALRLENGRGGREEMLAAGGGNGNFPICKGESSYL